MFARLLQVYLATSDALDGYAGRFSGTVREAVPPGRRGRGSTQGGPASSSTPC